MTAANPRTVVYRNARIIDPANGRDEIADLLTQDKNIAAVGINLIADGISEYAQIIDCDGLVLAPGLVDIRVQLREPGAAYKEDILSLGRAAVAGGVTTIVATPNIDAVIDDVAAVEFIARRARDAKLTKVYCAATITQGLGGREISEFGLLCEAGVVAFCDGPRAIADSLVMVRALAYARAFDAILMQYPEDPRLAEDGVMNAGELSTRLGLIGIPTEAETILLQRDVALAAMTGGRYHASHITTGAAIDIIRRAKAEGVAVTCDTAPPYFALNELAVGDYRTFAKLSPPLRGEADRQAVVQGLVDGVIDAIASDHAAQDQDSKRLPFEQAEPGAVGVETLLPLTLELVHNGHLGLSSAIALITTAPADLLGLPAGRLTPGAPADLVLFDPDRAERIDAEALVSRTKNTPFDGRGVQGRVEQTVIDGRCVFQRSLAPN